MQITSIFYTFNLNYAFYINIDWTSIKYIFTTVRSKSYRTCPYSEQINEQINKQIVLSININKFVNNK